MYNIIKYNKINAKYSTYAVLKFVLLPGQTEGWIQYSKLYK